MKRDYSTLLGRAKTIREWGDGYMDGREKIRFGRTEVAFRKDVNRTAYSLLKDTQSPTHAKSVLSQELGEWTRRLQQSDADFDWQSDVEFVRQSLLSRIDAELGKSTVTLEVQHWLGRIPDLIRAGIVIAVLGFTAVAIIQQVSQ